MEQHLQTKVEDQLIGSLTYGHEPGAAFIESARLVKFRAEAGDRFSDSSRTIRFRLQDQCWLQSSSVRLAFQLNNLGTHELEPIAHPASMFTSYKVYTDGQLLENIEEAGPLCNILDRCKPVARRMNESAMNHPLTTADGDARGTLAANESRRIIMDLPLGILRTKKMLPMHLVNIIIELTLGDKMAAFKDNVGAGTEPTRRSETYDISDVALLASCMHLNSTVNSQYLVHLDGGGELPISLQTVSGTKHISNSNTFTLSVSRSCTRLKQIYFVLVKSIAGKKEVRDHENPVTANNVDLRTDKLSFQVQCGSARYPDFPAVGTAEHYFRFLQALGKMDTNDDVSLSPTRYFDNAAVYAVDFEKASSEAAFTGINTQGKTLTLTVNNAWASDDADAREIYVYQVFDSILNVRKTGVDIAD